VIGNCATNKSSLDHWGCFASELVRRASVITEAMAEEILGNPLWIGIFIDNEMG